ncbi:hypothetical protein ACFPM7_23220 [Actinokineospora guangxiensis]|uniref:Uncharacterized protein n=1 Tax=Actinokineospora guangxiensis TaxID=1490288 RepID=A0ABW0ERP0_9PSEU
MTTVPARTGRTRTIAVPGATGATAMTAAGAMTVADATVAASVTIAGRATTGVRVRTAGTRGRGTIVVTVVPVVTVATGDRGTIADPARSGTTVDRVPIVTTVGLAVMTAGPARMTGVPAAMTVGLAATADSNGKSGVPGATTGRRGLRVKSVSRLSPESR